MQDLRKKVDSTSDFLKDAYAKRQELANKGQTAVLDKFKPYVERVDSIKVKV